MQLRRYAVACAAVVWLTMMAAASATQLSQQLGQQLQMPLSQQFRVDGAHGEDSPQCGPSGFPPCRTIQQAIDNAAAGDTVLVSAGTGSYDCNHNGTVVSKSLSLWSDLSAGPVIVDCKTVGRGFVFRGALSIDVRGFVFLNGLTTDSEGGSALAFFIPTATITDAQPTNATGEQRTRGRPRDRMRANSTSPAAIVSVSITVSDCVFEGHVNSAGAAVVIQSIGSAIEGIAAIFRNCTFTDNRNAASPSSAINNAAGAIAVTYMGSVIGYNSLQFVDCDFIRNSGGSNMLYGGAGGVSISYVASGWIALMSESFIRCRFIECHGGNGNGAAGAGALSVLYQAVTSAIDFTVSVELNSFLLSDVLVTRCSGGSDLRAPYFTPAGLGAAGGVVLVQSAGVLICRGCSAAANASVAHNVITVSGSVIESCAGGFNVAPSQETGGTACAGGIAIVQTAVAGENADLQHNAIVIANSSVLTCSGGSNSQSGSGGAGGVAVVQQLSAGSSVYPPLVGSVLISTNVHRFSDLVVRGCSGGNSGAGVSFMLGAGGMLVAVIIDELVQQLVVVGEGIAIRDLDQSFERVEMSNCTGGSQGQNAAGLGTAVAGAGGLVIWVGSNGAKQDQGSSFPISLSALRHRFSHLNVSDCSGASANYASSGHVTAAAGFAFVYVLDLFTSMDVSDCSLTVADAAFIGNQGVSGSWGGSTANLAGAVAITISMANAGNGPTAQVINGFAVAFNDVVVDSNSFGTQYAAAATAVASAGISVALLLSASTASSSDVSIAFQSVDFLNNRAGIAISGSTSITGGGAAVAYVALSVAMQSNAAIFNNCTWLNNQQVVSEPGLDAGAVTVVVSSAVRAAAGNLVALRNNTFFDNVASLQGGALRVADVQNEAQLVLQIEDTLFAYNFALCADRTCCCSGGAVSVTNAEAQMTRTTFTGNVASYSAGALLLQGASSLLCDQCTLEANSASVVGQIIQLQSQLNATFVRSRIDMGGSAGSAPVTAALSGFASQFNFEQDTTLVCGPGEIVRETSNSFGCELCAAGTYNLGSGSWIDSGSIHSKCLPCPFGGACSGGANIQSVVGYWGADTGSGVVFTACASGEYCCTAADATDGACPLFNQCRSTRTGVLCGECVDGFSECLSSTTCRVNSDCHDAAWFLPLMLLLGATMAAYFISTAADPAAVAGATGNPPIPPTASSGLFNIIAYFFQLAPFVTITTNGNMSVAMAVVSLLGDLFTLKPTGGSSGRGVCLAPNMKAVAKEAVHLCTPLFILLPFLCWIAIIRRVKQRSKQQQLGQVQSGASDGLLALVDATGLQRSRSRCWTPLRLRVESILRTPLSSTLLIGLVRILLFTYATLVAHVFTLLQCVPIGGRSGLYLLQAAYVQCFQPWQQALVALVALMFAFPAVLAWAMRPMEAASSSSSPRSLPSSLRRALLCSLGSPYRRGSEYFESLLVLLRLVVATAATFIELPVVRLLVLFLACGLMLLAHMHCRPFRTDIAQHTQTAALASLMILTLLSVPAVTLSANASVPAGSSSSALASFVIVQLLCLFLPLLVLGCGMLVQRRSRCPCHSDRSTKHPRSQTQAPGLHSEDDSLSIDAHYTALGSDRATI